MTTARKSRSGPKFFHGDDLTKTGADRKRTSKTEPWEKRRSGGSRAKSSSRSQGGGARAH